MISSFANDANMLKYNNMKSIVFKTNVIIQNHIKQLCDLISY